LVLDRAEPQIERVAEHALLSSTAYASRLVPNEPT
jgi:hypothetical protein